MVVTCVIRMLSAKTFMEITLVTVCLDSQEMAPFAVSGVERNKTR